MNNGTNLKRSYFFAWIALWLSLEANADPTDTGKILVMDRSPTHSVAVKLPPNAPSIVSDYRSAYNESGLIRAYPMTEHTGIDIKLAVGSSVLAAAAGRVDKAGFERFGGNSVRINHGNLTTIYLHLDSIHVAAGDFVTRGQVIGASGASTAVFKNMLPHLHFGVIRVSGTDEQPVETPKGHDNLRNPHQFWHDGPGLITCFEENRTYSDEVSKFTYPARCLSGAQ